jgi:hypothetical protein
MLLGEELAICLLLYVFCLNHKQQHQICRKMLQNCLKEEIDIPKKGANHAKVVPTNKVPMSPTWVRSSG